tara:strand:+ start:2462 stop:2830 length:369 start_codon:yes stop_codon:yes gene_type:complete
MSSTVIDLLSDTDDADEETDDGADLVGFVIPDTEEIHVDDTTPEQDEEGIVAQFDKVKDMGTCVVEGRRRSTRNRTKTVYYQDSDFEDLMYGSADECSEVECSGDACSEAEYSEVDYSDEDL